MKRLDRVQIGCLSNMLSMSAGRWDVTCGWAWQGSERKTVLVLEGLVARGLVEPEPCATGKAFKITEKGIDAAKEAKACSM